MALLFPFLVYLKLTNLRRENDGTFFGFQGETNTEIYPNARNALQGIAYCRVNGIEKLFVTQRPVGPTWSDKERVRIVEFNLYDDGRVVNHVAYSPELNLGHGFDLSAMVENGQVYLYTSSVTNSGEDGESAGKGFSKITWRGQEQLSLT